MEYPTIPFTPLKIAAIFFVLLAVGCGEVTVVSSNDMAKPPAATREKVVAGAAELKDAPALDYGIRYRIYMDAADPAKKQRYFKLRVDTGAPLEQRFRVFNLHPGAVKFIGRCTPYERKTAEVYFPSRLKLGGAWQAEGQGGYQENKVEIFSATEVLLAVVAKSGAGFIEIDLEKYY